MCSSSIVIESHNFKILLFLIHGYHHTLWLKDIAIPSLLSTPQFQTFTNLLIGIFGVSNPTYLFFEIGRNYVSIIVNIISNNTVLQCYLLCIFVSIWRLLQFIVCIGVSTSPPTSKTSPPLIFYIKTATLWKRSPASFLFCLPIVCPEILYLSTLFCSDEYCIFKIK